jgi:hypothetical protein
MLQIFNESGIGGWMVLLFTIAGLAAVTTVGRRWGRPGSVAAAWAVAILAAGALGFGTGQRSVNRAFATLRAQQTNAADEAGTRPDQMVIMLSRGTSEAAGNYVLAGTGALMVMLVGGVFIVFRKRDPQTAPARPSTAPAASV